MADNPSFGWACLAKDSPYASAVLNDCNSGQWSYSLDLMPSKAIPGRIAKSGPGLVVTTTNGENLELVDEVNNIVGDTGSQTVVLSVPGDFGDLRSRLGAGRLITGIDVPYLEPYSGLDVPFLELYLAHELGLGPVTHGVYDPIGSEPVKEFVGESQSMAGIYDQIESCAAVDAGVLILGESGTGKDLVAQAIHHGGARRDKPYNAQNCSAIPEAMLESELFGHVKGAFTGSQYDRLGKLGASDGGTFFLDEIGDMSLALQAKFLRVIEDGYVCKVGMDEGKQVDVRIIAATHRDLRKMVAEGTFRRDLYHRLKVATIELPTLGMEERRADIPALAVYYLDKFAHEYGKRDVSFSQDALRTMMEYGWPGNVRELENSIEGAVVFARDGDIIEAENLKLDQDDLVPREASSRDSQGQAVKPYLVFDQPTTLAEIEKAAIGRALVKALGNKKKAAEIIGIDRKTFYAKLKKYDIDVNTLLSNGEDPTFS